MADNKILVVAGSLAAGLAVVIGAIFLFKREEPPEDTFRCGGPDNKDWQQYVDGEWITLEYDSPKCGIEECIEGEAICIGADRHRCVEGKWVLEEENAPECTIPIVASLYGRVSDKSNGLSVEALITADGASGISDNNGNYLIDNLALGSLTITCLKDGYKDYSRNITLSKDTELNIQLAPVSAYPEVAQATCPYYDATTFYAPNALEKLFEHVLEAKHIDWASPWCLFCGMEFEPETTEWKTVRKVVNHWVEAHLDKLTAEPGGGKVYVEGLPAQAMPGEQITIEHGFELESAPGEYHIVLGFLNGSGFSGVTHNFTVSQTGMYDYTETIQIPARQWQGLYRAISRCVYKQYNPDLEYVVWEVEVGSIYIGEEVPPPPSEGLIPCVYCPYVPSDERDLFSHMETNHPGQPYPVSGRLEPASVSRTPAGYVITQVKFLVKFFAPLGAHPPSPYGEELYQVYIDVDGMQSRDVRPPADGNFHDLELTIYRPGGFRMNAGFYEVWINCNQYWYVGVQTVNGLVWWKDKQTGIWLRVE
jgi:hypothetical protein